MNIQEIFGENGLLSAELAHFELRRGQVAMAEAISALFHSPSDATDHDDLIRRLLVIEAETGIGKTMAYLIPAVLSGLRIVVSTATLTLQDQILDKDIPLLSKILGQEIPVICLKGRQNYLCLYRWHQHRDNPQLGMFHEQWVHDIDTWLQSTETGDKAELDWMGEKTGFWSKISCHGSECLGSDCPEATLCFINQVRKRAGSCRLIIVNHHLLFSDLALKKEGFGEVLPRYEGVIFDEAHHLENIASTYFGKTFSHYQLLDLLGDIEIQAKDDLISAMSEQLLILQSGLRSHVDTFVAMFPAPVGRFPLQSLIDNLTQPVWNEAVEQLAAHIDEMVAALKKLDGYGEVWLHLAARAEQIHKVLLEIALQQEGDATPYVYWYERRERTVALSATPIKVAEKLQEHLYSSVDYCVLTSATLTSGGSFGYIKERLGLPEEVTCLQFSSPFDYRHRTMLYVPENSFPEPTSEDYLKKVCTRILDLLRLSEGRALILCTSYRGMDYLAAYLEMRLDFPLLVQGRAARHALLRDFRIATHSVLLATASFWEGVDVVGESLSCVIIDKLPFEVPSDPVIGARIARNREEGGNPFFDFQVPRAILALRQGAGRLMRAATDRGIIAVMDVRLFTKGYGRNFLKSLPPSPITRNLADIETFFKADTGALC